MKIAFLNIYSGVVDRGAETYVKELAQRLAKNNYITVFQSGKPLGGEGYKIEQISVGLDSKFISGQCDGFLRRLFLDYSNRKIFGFRLNLFRKL